MYGRAKEEQRMILRFMPWLTECMMILLPKIKDTGEEKAVWGGER